MARKKAPPAPADDGPNLLIGYARVSTEGQSLEGQLLALERAGVAPENIFKDVISAAKKKRPGFDLAMKALRRGDTLVVYSLSRLGRDMVHLHEINQRLIAEGVNLKSLTEEIDTRSAMGKFMFNALAMFAQFERDITIERTRMGVGARKAAGLPHGRPPKLSDKQKEKVRELLADETLSINKIARRFKVAPGTITYAFPLARVEYLKKPAKKRRT